MKRFLYFLCLTLLILCVSYCNIFTAKADELDDAINEEISEIDFSNLSNVLEEIGGINVLENLRNFLDGDYSIDFKEYLSKLFDTVFFNIKTNLPLFISLICICLILSISNSFFNENKDQTFKSVFIVGFLVIASLLFSKICYLIKKTYSVIDSLIRINETASPILLTLMLASGGVVSASIYSPMTIILSLFMGTFIKDIIMPVTVFLFISSISSNISDDFSFKGFEDFFTSFLKWSLGLFSLLFTLFLSIQGITSGIHDGISFKFGKYLLQSSLPIIGNIVGSGFEFLIAGGVLIKNATGIIILLSILIYVLPPIIEIIVFSLLLKLLSALTSSFTNTKINSFFLSISKSLNYVLAILIICSIMIIVYIFLLTVSVNVL